MNYKDTVLTPKTDFPMRAGLVKNEPIMQAQWAKQDLYRKIREARADRPKWVLHDGPPYANGNIHVGHALNKVLKDIVVKHRTMQGLDAPYVPGWDCHGLPIEHKVMGALGDKIKNMSATEVRALCQDHAEQFIKLQSEQFQRLGVFGDYSRPYTTMSRNYEGDVLDVFAELVKQGLVYRELKPVHWCPDCNTSLADAELEYEDRRDTSIFVNFRMTPETISKLGLDANMSTSLMIWTTTPWTLPANLAIAVHPDFDYVLVRYSLDGQDQISLVADGLVDYVMSSGKIEEFTKLDHVLKGKDLANCTYQHAFLDRTSPVVLADYVTLKDEKGNPTGTGLVHTAPGHGAEDYHTGKKHGLDVYSPVKADGCFDDSVPEWIRGKSVWAGNKIICERLVQSGHMFYQHQFNHSYPHCWRSKSATIFRCTEQWFVSVDKPLQSTERSLRELANEHLKTVQWIPNWGQSRIEGMLSSRPDWCISRQRAWGLPIPAFFDRSEHTVLTPEIARRVGEHFREHGSDAWFKHTPEQILGDCPLPDGLTAAELTKEADIFDVWFESGSSWAAVCAKKEGYELPVELYLEGSDQHRGWFQLSLLPALGVMQKAPFKTVLTHGFVVDEEGRKMSKSGNNVVDPLKEIDKYGADILRLWVASVDYQDDIRCSDQLIKSLSDEYRKVRNTLRYLLGSLRDHSEPLGIDHTFDPQVDAVDVTRDSIDAWARMRLHRLIDSVTGLYDQYAFYKVFRQIHEFCNLDMSQIYFVAIKDRLYCDALDSPRRRQTQTVLHEIANHLIRLVAPILVHTAEEAWSLLPAKLEKADSVHLAHYPHVDTAAFDDGLEQDWTFILTLRDQAMLQLEHLKREQGMKNPLDARAMYKVNSEHAEILKRYGDDLEDVLGVGSHVIVETAGEPSVSIEDVREKYHKCARSWKRRPDVGEDPDYADLSSRDAQVVRPLKHA